MRRTWRLVLLTAAAAALVTTSCSDDDGEGGAAAASARTGANALDGDITVFAATSLSESFTAVGDAFSAANPGVDVTFSFDASSALVQQIVEGAPADVFASADTTTMDTLTDAVLDGSEPVLFATNLMTIIVAPGNPLGITGVADLTDPDVSVVVCAPEVPCGSYAEQIFAAAGIDVTPVSFEQNVRGVATKVTAGEADAGLVYVTDVTAAGDAAEMVAIPGDINVVAQYPIATVAASQNPEAGEAFIDFLTGPEGQDILARHGFGPP
jgi:molybdate transport system substrate-binding protein